MSLFTLSTMLAKWTVSPTMYIPQKMILHTHLGSPPKLLFCHKRKNWQALNSMATSIPIEQSKRVAMNGSSSHLTFTSVGRHRNIFHIHHMQTHSYSVTSYFLSKIASFVKYYLHASLVCSLVMFA